MANLTIFFLLGLAISILAVVMMVPAAFAFARLEFDIALNFGVAALITAFVGVALIVATRGRGQAVSRIQTVIFALLIWTVLPLFAAIPFVATPLYLSWIAAIFEAVSAFTTTGASGVSLSDFPSPFIFWYALLQWLGGFLSLLTVFTIVAPSGLCGSLTQVSIPGSDREDFTQTLQTTFMALVPAYGLFTLICLVLLWSVGLPFFDALCLSFSTLSTGGFVPHAGGLVAYHNTAAEVVLMIFMIVGATSAMTHRNLLTTRRLKAFENRETSQVIATCLIVGGFLSLWLFFTTSASALYILKTAFFTGISLVTTTGYQVTPTTVAVAPYGFIIAIIFVGGATFSTAGGMKLYRFSLITKQSLRELTRILHPHGIAAMRAAGREYDIQTMKSIWALFVVYLLLVGLTALALGLAGTSFELAFLSATAMLSNVAPAVTGALGQESVLFFLNSTDSIKLVLMTAMILGRVEILVLMSLANIAYWRSR